MGGILVAAIPHIARYFYREVSTPPKWCDTPPPWYIVLHRHICVIPHLATYYTIIARYPPKNKHERVSRYYRYKPRAILKVSLLGLLGWHDLHMLFQFMFDKMGTSMNL